MPVKYKKIVFFNIFSFNFKRYIKFVSFIKYHVSARESLELNKDQFFHIYNCNHSCFKGKYVQIYGAL